MWHLLFVSFFVFIGVWWLSFIPLFGIVLFSYIAKRVRRVINLSPKEALTAFLSSWIPYLLDGRIMLGDEDLPIF